MSDEAQSSEEQGEERTEQADETQGTRRKMGDGIKQGIGVLSAFKDALEETIQEARERGDLSADRAKEVMKDALEKAHSAGERARDRLDFASQADLDSLKQAVRALRDRVTELEESVFGSAEGGSGDGGENGGEAPATEAKGEAES